MYIVHILRIWCLVCMLRLNYHLTHLSILRICTAISENIKGITSNIRVWQRAMRVHTSIFTSKHEKIEDLPFISIDICVFMVVFTPTVYISRGSQPD